MKNIWLMFCKESLRKIIINNKNIWNFSQGCAAVGCSCLWLVRRINENVLVLDLHPGRCWGAEYLPARPEHPHPPEQRSKNASVAGGLSHSQHVSDCAPNIACKRIRMINTDSDWGAWRQQTRTSSRKDTRRRRDCAVSLVSQAKQGTCHSCRSV